MWQAVAYNSGTIRNVRKLDFISISSNNMTRKWDRSKRYRSESCLSSFQKFELDWLCVHVSLELFLLARSGAQWKDGGSTKSHQHSDEQGERDSCLIGLSSCAYCISCLLSRSRVFKKVRVRLLLRCFHSLNSPPFVPLSSSLLLIVIFSRHQAQDKGFRCTWSRFQREISVCFLLLFSSLFFPSSAAR